MDYMPQPICCACSPGRMVAHLCLRTAALPGGPDGQMQDWLGDVPPTLVANTKAGLGVYVVPCYSRATMTGPQFQDGFQRFILHHGGDFAPSLVRW